MSIYPMYHQWLCATLRGVLAKPVWHHQCCSGWLLWYSPWSLVLRTQNHGKTRSKLVFANFNPRKWKTDSCARLASFSFFQVNFQLKRSTPPAAPKRRGPNSGHRGRVLPKKVQPRAARKKEMMMKQSQRVPAWNPQCPGQHFRKALFPLSHQMKHSFYFIIWDIFKYKHIQNNSEWSPSVPGVNPLMQQYIHAVVFSKIFRFWGYGLGPEGSMPVYAVSRGWFWLVSHYL